MTNYILQRSTAMFKKASIFASLLFIASSSIAQTNLTKGTWRAAIAREDGNPIVFNLGVAQQKGKTVFYIVNGEEKMLVNDVTRVKDSLFVDMPVFESSFKLKIESADSLSGSWIKRGAVKDVTLPFAASAKQQYRFAAVNGDATAQAAGKWKIDFVDGDKHSPAIGNFKQKGNNVTGSILTPSGDYRFLAGIVTGNLLQLSTFDGVHAMVFSATINGDQITDASSYSGKSYTQKWTATRDANAALPNEKLTRVRDGESGKLDFSFQDLDGKQVSINDARFKNKVVIIQLMGSWCPNCMDETAFMSDFYKKNKKRGVEMIGLAYEYTSDVERSKASLRKFQKRFDVQYPVLLASATVGDPQRTEKTLPQLTPIKVFPTTLILGKDGKIAEITTDFFGPGTGDYYTAFVAEFEKKIDALLK
jgi:peroxiredoxin